MWVIQKLFERIPEAVAQLPWETQCTTCKGRAEIYDGES